MVRVRLFARLAGLLALAGCFASETPLIASDEAVLPVDGGFTVCLEPKDPCLVFARQGDGYATENPEGREDPVRVRFAPLIEADGRQVFIAEARIERGEAYLYGLARRLPAPDPRGATMQIAALDCEELPEEVLERLEQEGATIEQGFITMCLPVSLDQLKAVLLDAHRDGLAMDAWWKAHGEDL